nr:YqzE family protein [Salipaludibacillus sp. CUR1]
MVILFVKQRLAQVIRVKTNDYVKFMTEQFVSYVDQPAEERKARREKKKQYRPPVSYRLFGMIPFAVELFFNKKSN